MERYNLNERANDPQGRKLFIQNFNFNGSELSFRFREVLIPPFSKEGRLSENYWEHPERKDEAFKIDVYEMNSFEEATDLMQDILNEHMIPELPKWDDSNNTPGEVTFGSATHVVFSRANLVVVVNSIGNKDIDVSPQAKELDRLFTYVPDLKENGNVFIPSFRMERNEDQTLLIEEPDDRRTVGQGVWYKFVTGKGSIRKIDGRLVIPEEDVDGGVTVFAFLGNKPVEKKIIRK